MNQASGLLLKTLRLLALATMGAAPAVYADAYSDAAELLRANQLAEALVVADTYLADKPSDPRMRFLKGVIFRSQGKTPEAIAVLTQLTQDFPELPEPYNNLAVVYASLGQYDLARTALEAAIRNNPGYATAHENLGDVYAKLASQAYARALEIDASNAALKPKLTGISSILPPAGTLPASAN